MPDRMPENMSDRMSEDLPVTKCINVMVGITRSKVIRLYCASIIAMLNNLSISRCPGDTYHHRSQRHSCGHFSAHPRSRSSPLIACSHCSVSMALNVTSTITSCRCSRAPSTPCAPDWKWLTATSHWVAWDELITEEKRLHLLVCDRELFISLGHQARIRNFTFHLGHGNLADQVRSHLEIHCIARTELLEVIGHNMGTSMFRLEFHQRRR